MADNYKDLINTIRAQAEGDKVDRESQVEILKDVDAKIMSQTGALQAIVDTLKNTLQFQKEVKRDEERSERLKKDAPVVEPSAEEKNPFASALSSMSESAQNGISALLRGGAIFAPLAAFGLAITGLRGWEQDAIRSLTSRISDLSSNLIAGARGLVTSIGDNIRNVFSGLSKTIGDAFNRLPGFIRGPIRFIADIGKTLGGIIGGIGAGIFQGAGGGPLNAIKDFFGKFGNFAKLVGKFLKPLGIVFSAFDGIRAFLSSDAETMLLRIGDGVAAFFGDFFGAPFDLLKSGITFLTDKLLGPDNPMSNALRSFSFEELIGNFIGGIFQSVQDAVDWIGRLFSDPVGALQSLWNGLTGGGDLTRLLFLPINLAVDWVRNTFGFSEEDAPPFNLFRTIVSGVSAAWTFVTNKISEAFSSFGNFIIDSARSFGVNLKADFDIALVEIADFFVTLPTRILAAIAGVLGGINITLPPNAITRALNIDGLGFRLLSEDVVDSIQAAAQAPTEGAQERVAQINAERERQLQAIVDSRGEVEARRQAQISTLEGDVETQRQAIVNQVRGGNTTTNNSTVNNYYSSTSLPLGSSDPIAMPA